MIVLTPAQYMEISDHSLRTLPNEACGLLGGVIKDDQRTVKKVYLLPNIDNRPDHFSMAPEDQFSAVKDMRKNGWVLLGNFHSHPASPARPSAEDKRLAFDPEVSYLILSLLVREQAVLKSFRILGDEVQPEEISIVEEG